MYGTDKLSDALKDLITCMLQANPMHRPAICEVLAHGWFGGETPTHEQIVQEFNQRDVKVQEKLEAERAKRRQLRDSTLKQSNDNAPRASEAPNKPIVEYIETGNAKTRFFTTVSPDILEEKLIEYLATNTIEYTQKKDKYQIDFTYFVQGTSFHVPVTTKAGDELEAPDSDTKVMGSKDSGETENENQVVKMRMKISVAPEESKTFVKDKVENWESDQAYCVEFSRKEGDQVYFATAYRVLTQTILSFAIEAV